MCFSGIRPSANYYYELKNQNTANQQYDDINTEKINEDIKEAKINGESKR